MIVVLIRVTVAHCNSTLDRGAWNNLALFFNSSLCNSLEQEARNTGENAINLGTCRIELFVTDGTPRQILSGTSLVGKVAEIHLAKAVVVCIKGNGEVDKVTRIDGAAIGFSIKLSFVGIVDLERCCRVVFSIGPDGSDFLGSSCCGMGSSEGSHSQGK